ncbi:MAG: hypothetical protein U0270_02610 [Labilithrix sp.]
MKHLPLSAILVALGAACYDPVHADDVASLGPEAPGVPEGPLHRPGQHCTTCHGENGPGEPQWSIAGTIFAVKGRPEPEVGARVTITDKTGAQFVLTTNAVGNFYVSKEQWDPVFPIIANVESQGIKVGMTTTIGRDGGCGACHRGAGNRYYMPAIFMRAK